MSEKRFDPSPQRLKKARKDGQIPKTKFISIALAWWCGILSIPLIISWVSKESLLNFSGNTAQSPERALHDSLVLVALIVGIVLVLFALCGIVASVSQTGVFLNFGQAKMKLQGFNIFSKWKSGASDSALGIVRVVVVLAFLFPVLSFAAHQVAALFEVPAELRMTIGVGLIKSLGTRGGAALTVLAIVAYALARWRFMRQHRMSLEDLKEEYKESEGDAHAKAHRRQEHQALSMQEVEKQVRKAKVIIVKRAG
jgi:flagellar biosynthetic protein FlhB